MFYGILQDLFPSVELPTHDYGKLKTTIENKLEKHGLQKSPDFIGKIIQMHETMVVTNLYFCIVLQVKV